jgi:hypothetical protein
VINVNRAKYSVPPRRLLCSLGGLTIAAALACSGGCDKEDTVRVYDAPKEAAPAVPIAAAKPIDFAIPPGWTQVDAGAMEYAHLRISADDPKAAVTLTPLPTQGGSLLPNVNRWQRQLKLPESPESDLPNLVKDLDLPAGKAHLVDLTGPGPTGGAQQRTVAVILPHGPQTWYLKLAGPATLVEAQRSNFDEFLKSVKFPEDGGDSSTDSAAGGPTPPPQATTEPSAAPEKLVKWNAPAEWKQQEISAGSPGLLSFKMSSQDKPGEQAGVTVTRMTVDNLDVLLQDINIWRGQVGLPPQPKLNANDAERVNLGGKEGAVFDFAGPQADKPEKRVVVAMVFHGSDLWFFKIIGSADLVTAQKPAFVSFVQSAEFGPQ